MNEGRVVRSEAGVLSDEQLTGDQRRAGGDVVKLIRAMATSEGEVDTPVLPFLPRIDEQRESRVLLIDGGRGSGKTALLVTLLAAFEQAHLKDGPKATKTASLKEEARTRRASPPAGWCQPDARIVPVGLLDLHPLPPSTNLLFYIIGRFERVVAWIEGDGKHDHEPVPWHLIESVSLRSRKAWQGLLRAAAMGWDGNVKERSARLDLEAYAVDLEETERQRLNVIDTFTHFLDTLCEDFARRRGLGEGKRPLFVLAIDDADMNPRRAVELLTTVRMLWHPRLAFLLTGHSPLFRQTLAEHCLGDVRSPLLHHHFVEGELTHLAEERNIMGLATDVYDKIVPWQHRCEIPSIPPGKRMDYAGLKQVFARIHVSSQSEDGSGRLLDEYFRKEEQLAEALPDRLRGLFDLAALARRQMEVAPNEAASNVVQLIWHRVLDTSGQPLGRYRGVVRVHPTTGALDIRDGVTRFQVDFNTLLAAQSPPVKNRPVVSFLQMDRIDVQLEGGASLDRSVTAALMLAANVAFDQARGTWNGPETGLSGYEGHFANSEYQLPGARALTHLAWPLPAGYSLPFYAALAWRWKEVLREATKREVLLEADPALLDADTMAERFLHTVVDLLWRKATTRRDLLKRDLPSLAAVVASLLHKGGTRTRAWALRRAGLLAAPEYGLSAGAANTWLEALTKEVGPFQWEAIREALAFEREVRLDAAGVLDVRKGKNRIDGAFPEHNWARVVEESNRAHFVPSMLDEPVGPAEPPPSIPAAPARTSSTPPGRRRRS